MADGAGERAEPGGVEYRTLRADERAAFLALMAAAFVDEDPGLFARYLDEDPQLGPDDTLVALSDGRIVSAVQIFTRTIRLRGEAVRLGGIGSVATHPEHEQRGLASALLRRAIAEMERRGMALALLFAERTGFYARHGFVQLRHPLLVVRRAGGAAPRAGRPFRRADLPQVAEIFEAYAGPRDATTVRDPDYWRAQLRFAGNPLEIFRVVERGGRIVAYARRIPFVGLARVMEHGCAPGAEAELALLLLGLAPGDAPLLVPRCDAALEAELRARAAGCDAIEFPDQMWRVLDRERLLGLAGLPRGTDDAALLAALVTGGERVYWPSDRF